MENTLEKQCDEQQVILDAVPAWIFFKNKENRFLRVNNAFAKAMKSSKEQLEGKLLSDIYPKEEADAFWKDDIEVMTSGNPKVNIVESVKTPDGMLWVQTDKIPYRDANNNIVGIIGFTINITGWKNAEEELKRKNKELENMNKIMIDRELKMVELRDELSELKGASSNAQSTL